MDAISSPAPVAPGASPAKAGDRFAPLVWLVVAIGSIAWWLNPTRFVPDDALFYVVTARRFALEGRQTFSGVFLTNGFHPLHFYLLSVYSWIISLINPAWLWDMRGAIPYSVILVAVAVWNLLRAERQLNLPRGLLALPALLYVMGFPILYTEGQAQLLAFSLFLRVAAWDSCLAQRRRAILTGLALALVALARLDSAIVCVTFIAWIGWRERQHWKNELWMFAAMAVLCVPYAVVNLHWFGGLVPVSGWLKSGFPASHFNLDIAFHLGSPLATLVGGYNLLFGIVPVVFSLVVALLPAFRRARHLHAAGVALLVGSLAHILYTITFAYCAKSYWYYVLNVVTGSFFFAFLMGSLSLSAHWRRGLQVGFLAVFVLLVVSPLGSSPFTAGVNEYLAKAQIDHHVVLSGDVPGIVAFYSHNDVIAADLLTANRPLVNRVLASDNALQALLDEARQAGKPVEYVIYIASTPFLKWDKENSELLLHSPRWVEQDKIIGRLKVGEPVFQSSDGMVVVWHLPETK